MIKITLVLALALLGAVGCMSSAPPPAPAMTPLPVTSATDWPTARRNLEVALRRSVRPSWSYRSQEPITSLRIRPDYFSFIDAGVARSDVTTSRRDEPYKLRRLFRFAEMGQPQVLLSITGPLVRIRGTPIPILQDGPMAYFSFATRAEAEAFATALREAYAAAQTASQAEYEFEQQALAWRAANPKPPLSPSADRHRVLGEAATRDKNFEEAIEHFEAALETDPTWPSGNFNLALLYEATEDWSEALRYMRRFLLLEPDSREAPAARQKLIIWEERARREASA